MSTERITALATVLWRMVRQAPVTVVLTLMMWVAYAVSGAMSSNRLHTLGLAEHAHMFSIRALSSGITTSTFRGLLVCTVVLLLAGTVSERALGSQRYALTALCSQLIAMPVGVALGLAVTDIAAQFAHTNAWGVELKNEHVLNPIAWIIGPLAVFTAIAPTLWRRRIRTFIVVAAFALVLYSGSLADFVFLTVTILGIAAGQVFFDSRNEENAPHGAKRNRMSLREKRVLVALIVGAVALSPVIAMLNPHAAGPFSHLTDLIWQPALSKAEITQVCGVASLDSSHECSEALAHARNNGIGPFMANVMPFVLQLVALVGLVRGRRLAWGIVTLFQIATIGLLTWEMLSLRHDSDPVIAGINFLAAVSPWILTTVLLILTRRLFTATSSQRAVRRFVVGSVGAGLLTSLSWVMGAYLLAEEFQPSLTWSMILKEWPLRYLPPPLSVTAGIEFEPRSAVAWGLLEWPGTNFWIVVAVLLWQVFRAPKDDEQVALRDRARQLLSHGTGDHLSWMTLWDGNRYWFSGDSYVAYRVKNNVALTLGGPVTPTGTVYELADVAHQFEAFAQDSGWHTAWYSVDQGFANVLRADGFRTQQVAEESVLDTSLADFTGKKFQNIRTARNHAGKESIESVWTTWQDADTVLREKIIALSEEWVSEKALPEMGFTLGTLEELKDPDTRLLLARDADGDVHGATSWLPRYKDGKVNGLVLDFMRRDPHGFRPVIEFLISEAMVTARAEGLEWISLSGAPLARSNSEPLGILDHMLDKVGEYMEPLYGFRSLAASKNKFQPQHHEWYLCYRDELSLPAIGLAVCASYLPEFKAKDGVEVARALLKSTNQ